ncbi:MAG TPA: oligopeptide transporter, OPT family [Thermoanaerobaculia bacterium]|nr:oligopeptide transporter, OPT family [Thermoanaerobaculia bacterium]
MFKPHVPADSNIPEFTWRGIVPGVLLGIAFGAANAYLGLRVGLTISTSIPIAVLTVAAFKLVRGNILEANMSQTIGSASSSLASGVIFTIPALFLWNLSPTLLQMTLLALAGGTLGVLFMIPLRRFLIEREHATLPYPEGTACAEVLIASQTGGGRARAVFSGLAIGALFKALVGGFRAVPDELDVRVPFLKKGEVGTEVSAALFGVGYILGPRVGAVMVGGGLLSSLVIIPAIAYWGEGRATPFYPEVKLTIDQMSASQIWSRYVRYIGAGAVAAAGILTLIKSIPTMVESFKVGTRQLRNRGAESTLLPRTSRDLPFATTLAGAFCVIGLLATVPQAFGALDVFWHRLVAAILVSIFAFFFVTVSSRIVGLVGVTSNPTSGMTIAALLGTSAVFLAMGWTGNAGKMGALTVGTVVAIAASIAGDMSQDLKTGYILGATPRRQQLGELIGVLGSATFVCLAVLLIGKVWGFGTKEIPAPQATLMKLVIEGVLEQSLPWVLVGIGVAITVVAALFRLPTLAFAVGVYLPVATMVPIFLGGLLRWWSERSAASKEEASARGDHGVLLGSGFVGGEGLVGFVIAIIAAILTRVPEGLGYEWAGAWAPSFGALVFVALILWFWFSVRAGGRATAEETPRAS